MKKNNSAWRKQVNNIKFKGMCNSRKFLIVRFVFSFFHLLNHSMLGEVQHFVISYHILSHQFVWDLIIE